MWPLLISLLAIPVCIASPSGIRQPAVLNSRQDTSQCHDVHLFLARGAGDPYPGTQGPLVDAVCNGLPSCDSENILYVGTFDAVCNSVKVGVVNATQQITAYATRCPNSKLVLCGHSEGAAVILNTIGGGGTQCIGGTMPATNGMEPISTAGDQIVAVAITGDMRHVANQDYNVGTGANRNGIWPRTQAELSGLDRWSNKIRSWCDQRDPVCAGGGSVAVHGAYMNQKEEIAAWIHGML